MEDILPERKTMEKVAGVFFIVLGFVAFLAAGYNQLVGWTMPEFCSLAATGILAGIAMMAWGFGGLLACWGWQQKDCRISATLGVTFLLGATLVMATFFFG